jgi:hypothetical protein
MKHLKQQLWVLDFWVNNSRILGSHKLGSFNIQKPILRLYNLQPQRQRCGRLVCFFQSRNFFVFKTH